MPSAIKLVGSMRLRFRLPLGFGLSPAPCIENSRLDYCRPRSPPIMDRRLWRPCLRNCACAVSSCPPLPAIEPPGVPRATQGSATPPSKACNWKRCRSRSSIHKSASAQPLDEKLVKPVGRIQRDPVPGAVDLLIAQGPFTKRPTSSCVRREGSDRLWTRCRATELPPAAA